MPPDVKRESLAVDVAGEGEPIVFVHAFPLDRRMWRHQARAFSRTHRVIAIDARGFGESGPAPEVMTMEDYAADIAAVLDELGIGGPVTLCGASMGGYVAFAFYRAYRERLARLILCDTKAAADSEEKRKEREATARRALAEGTEFLIEGMIPKIVAARADSGVIAEMEKMVRTASPGGVAAALRGMAEREDSTELLSRIEVPTLVICGEEDQISPPEEMREMAAAIPGARFEIVPGAGHVSPLENAARVNHAMDAFLTNEY